MNRRDFLIGSAAVLAAPAIVRVGSLMPVSVTEPALTFQGVPIEYDVDSFTLSWTTTSMPTGTVRIFRNLRWEEFALVETAS